MRDGERVARLSGQDAGGHGRPRGDVAHPVPAGAAAQKKQVRAAEQDRDDVAVARRAWAAMQPGLDATRLVFLDESRATTCVFR